MAKLWGGRFGGDKMNEKVLKFTSSIDVDNVLARHDCLSTRVHVEMLAKVGYISPRKKKNSWRSWPGFLRK